MRQRFHILPSLIVLLTMFAFVSTTATAQTTYYTFTNGNPRTLTLWWTGTDGTGTHPANFTTAGDIFIIQNNNTMTTAVTAWTVTGSLVINGGSTLTATAANVTVGGLTINSLGTLTTSRILTVNGATDITGTINFITTARADSFDDITLNSGAVWNEAIAITPTITGSLTNNATTFTASTGLHTFNRSTGGTISGATATVIPRVTFTTSYTNSGTLTCATALTVTGAAVVLTNDGTITASTALSGTGRLTNSVTGTLNLSGAGAGSCAITTLANAGIINRSAAGTTTTALANFTNTGTINISGSGTIAGITNNAGGIVNHSGSSTITSFNNATSTSTLNISTTPTVPTFTTLTVSAAGNTVNYNGAGPQTVKDVAYSNLTTSGSGTKTWTEAAGRIMTGDLTVGDGTTLSVGGAVALTVNGTTTIGTGTSGALSITATGTKTFTGAVTINANGALTETAAAQLAFGNDVTINGTLTLFGAAAVGITGNFQNNGTFNCATSTVTFTGNSSAINGSAATQTFNNIVVNKTAGQTLSVGGSTTTLNVGGTFTETTGDFTAPATMSVTGAMTLTAGTFTAGTNLTASAAWTNNGGTFTPGSGTVTFIGNSSAINGSAATQTFNNIIINKTAGQTLSVAGSTTTLTLNGSLTETQGNFTPPATLNVGGDWTRNSGTFTQGTGTVTFNGSSAQNINGSAATTFNNLTLNNSAGLTNTTTTTTVNGTLTLTSGTYTLTSGLTMGNGATIIRADGSLSTAPTFGTTVNLQYTNTVPINTGTELPTVTTILNNLTFNNSAPVTLAASPQVNGTMTLTGGELAAGSNDITMTGANWTNNGGTFTPGSGTVTFTGSSSAINGTAATQTFNNIIINETAGQTLSVAGSTTTLTLNGNLTETQGDFTPPATLSVAGTFTHTAGTLTAGTNISVGGDWTRNGGTFTQGAGTVTFNGNSAQGVNGSSATTFNNLTLNNAAGVTNTVTSPIVNGTLTLTSGTYTLTSGLSLGNVATIVRGNGSLSAAPTFGTNINVQYANSTPINSGYELPSTDILSNLTFANSAVVTLTASPKVNGNMTLTSGELAANSYNITMAGTNWTNNGGTFTPGTGTVTFSGTGQIIGGSAVTSFGNLTINSATTGNYSFNVNGILTLNANLSMSGANALTLGQNSSIAGTGDVTGITQRTYFEVGPVYSFANAFTSVQFTSATDVPTSVVVNLTTGSAPAQKTDAILRTYDITKTGGTGEQVTLRLHYLDAELNGNTETSLVQWYNNVGTYVENGKTTSNQTDNWVEKTQLSSYAYTWTLANFVPGAFTSAASGNWNDPATWGLTGTPTEGVNYPGPEDNVIINGDFTVTLTANHSAASVTISDNLSLTPSALAIGTYTLTIGSGGLAINTGLLWYTTVTVGGGVLNINGNLTIANNANSKLDLSGGANSVLNITGTFTKGANSTFIAGTSTVNYNGTTPQTLLANNNIVYANVTVNNAAGVTLGAALSATNLTGNLSVQSGTFNNGGFAITGNAGNTFEVANGATFNLTGTSAFPTSLQISLGATSVVRYSGTTQTIAQQTYGILEDIISGAGSTASSVEVLDTYRKIGTGTTTLSATSGDDLVIGKFLQSNGTLIDNGRTITVTGTGTNTWSHTSGTFTTTGTTIFLGSNPEIGTETFYNLNINAGNTALAAGILTSTNFSLMGGTFDPSTYVHSISGNFSLWSGSKLIVRQATRAGNYTKNPTSMSSGATVEYINSAATIDNFTYSNLIVSGTVSGSSTATISDVFTVSGTYNNPGGLLTFADGATIVNNGTLNFSSLTIGNTSSVNSSSSFGIYGTLTVGTGGDFSATGITTLTNATLSNSGTLTFHELVLNGTINANTSYTVHDRLTGTGSMNASSGTVTLGNNCIFDVPNISFQDLTIGGVVTANLNFEVKGNLNVTVSGNLSPTSGTVTINGGSISNSGTLSFQNLTTSGTVTMNSSFIVKSIFSNGGTINQTSGLITLSDGTTINNTGSLTFNNLTISGATTAGGSFAVNGILTLNGNLTMGANTLTMGGSATTTGTGDATGNISRTNFSVGTTYSFGNAFTTIQLTSAATLPTSIVVNVAVGSAPAAKTDAILRIYNITETGGSYSSILRLHHLTGELNGNSATGLDLWKNTGSYSDVGRTDYNATDKWVEKDNIGTLTAEWTLANKTANLFTAANNGNWNDPVTWGLSGTPVEGVNYPGPVDNVFVGGAFAVTLTANHSAASITVQSEIDGTALLEVQNFTLNIGTGGLTITGGASDSRIAAVTVSSGNLAVTGSVTLNASSAVRAQLDISSGVSQLSIGGAFTKNTTGTFAPGSSSTVNFNGTAAQTLNVTDFTYANVTLNNSSATGISANTAIASGNITGNLRVLSGTFDNGGYEIADNALRTFEVANGAQFILSGTSSFPTVFGTITLGSTSTVKYAGTNQTISQQSYGNLTDATSVATTINTALTISGTYSKTGTGTTTLSGTSGDDISVAKFTQSAGTFIDNGRKITVTGTGANTWLKTSGTFTATGTVVFTGAAPQIGTSNFGTLEIAVGSGNMALATGILNPTHLVLTSGAFDPDVYTHSITSNFTLANGTTLKVKTATYSGNYSKSPTTVSTGSIVEYINSGATISNAFSYADLKISGTVTGSSNPTVIGAFTVAGTFNNPGGTVTLNDGASIVNSGTLNFSNLTIPASATVTSSANFGINGTLTVGSSGVFSPAGTTTLNDATLSNSGTLSFTNLALNGTITANTDYSLNGIMSGNGTLNATSGTVTLNTGASLTATNVSFQNLTVGGVSTANTSYTVKGTLSVGSSGNLNASSGTVTVTGGTITNSGTLSFNNLSTSGTVTMNTSFIVNGVLNNSGTINQTAGVLSTGSGASITNTGTLALNNMTIDGSTTGNNSFNVNGVLTLNNNLTMTSGNTLTMGASSTTTGAGDVIGRIQRTSFAVGTAYSFGNAFTTIQFTAATTTPTSVVIEVTASAPPEKTDAISRSYNITKSGGTGETVTLRMHYLNSELGVNDELSLTEWNKSGSNFVEIGQTATNQTDKWVEYSGITTYANTWTLANFVPIGFNAAIDGYWDQGATWGNPGNDVEGSGYPGSNDIANISFNGTITVTLRQNQSCKKLSMAVPGGFGANTRTLAVGSYTLNVGSGGIYSVGTLLTNRINVITVAGGTLNVESSISISTTVVTQTVIDLTGGTGSTLNLGGSISRSAAAAGQILFNETGILNLNGTTGGQTFDVRNSTFGNVYLNNTSSGVTLLGDISATNVLGDLRVQSGLFNTAGYAVAGNTGKTIQLGANTTLVIPGTSTFPSGFTPDINTTSSTVNYSGAAQNIADQAYGNLILGGTDDKTISSALSVAGSFTYSSTGTTLLSGTAGQNMTAKTVTISSGIFNDNGRTINVLGTNGQVWTKSGGTFTSTGTAIFSGEGAQIGASNFATLTINVGIGKTATALGNLTPTNFTLTTGTFDPGLTYTHTISSAFTISDGTTLLVRAPNFSGNYLGSTPTTSTGSTVDYTNSGASISNAFTYRNLKISGTVTGSANATVNEAFTVTGTFTPTSGTMIMNNGSSIVNNGTISFRDLQIAAGATVTTSSSFTQTGSLTIAAGGTFAPQGTVTMTGGSIVNGGSLSFNNLSITNPIATSSSFTINGALSILTNGDLSASSGTITMNNGSSISNSWVLSFNDLHIAGTVTSNTNYSLNGTLTVDASGVLDQSSGTITALSGSSIINNGGTLSFKNLSVTGPITANTNFTVKSSLSVGSSGNLSTTSGTVTMNDGSSISNTGTLSLSGLAISGGTVTGYNSFAASGALTLNGNISLGSNTIDLGTATTISGTGDITGNVRRSGTFSTGTSYSFGNQFSTVTFASGTLPTSINFNISIGAPPAEKTDAINRYYDLSATGAGTYSATVRLHFLTGELNGNDAATLSLWRKVGVSAYADLGKTSNNLTDNWVEKTGISSIAGSWTMANQLPAGFYSVVNGNWNVGSTWGNDGNDVEGSGYPGPSDNAYINNNITVTLSASQSALRVYVNGYTLDGQSVLAVGANTLNIGTGGLRITGGSTDTRIAQVTVAGGTINVNGDVTLNTSSAPRSVLDLGATSTSTLSLTGALTKTSTGTFIAGTSSTVNFNSTTAGQTMDVNSFTFANVNLNNTNGSGVTLSGNITGSNVTGDIRLQTGSFVNGGYSITGNSGKTFEVANGATFILNGTSTFPTVFTMSLGTNSNVSYSGGLQSVTDQSYGNLTLAGSTGKTIPTSLNVAGTFTYSSPGSTSLSATGALTCAKFSLTAGTFEDNGRTITVTGSGASAWSKTGGTFTATGTAVFTGTAPQIGASNFNTLEIAVGSGNTATATAALTPTNLVLTSGTFDPGTLTHTISSNFTLANGTTLKVNTAGFASNYSKSPTTVSTGSIVDYTNSNGTVSNAFEYADLKISGTISGSSSPTVNGAFTVTGTFNNPGGTVTLNNGASIVNSGTLNFSNVTIPASATVTSSANFGISGILTVNGTPSATFAPSGTITMNNGASIVNSGSLTFSTLSIVGTVSTSSSFGVSNSLDLNSSGNLSPPSGVITMSGTSSIANNSGVLNFSGLTIAGTVSTASNFTIGGALSVSSGSLNASAGTMTMTNGASISNSATLSFYNLAISTNSTVSTSSDFTIKGNLSVGTSAVFTPSGSSTMSMPSGSSISNSGTLTFVNLTISSGTVTGNSDFTVNGTLSLSGTLAMGSKIVTMGASSITSGSGDVTGNVRRTSISVGTSYSFGNQYSIVTINSATTPPSSIIINIAIGSAPAEKTDAILRKYTVSENGGVAYLATMRFHYLDGELNGNSASVLTLWKDNAGTYQNQGRTGTVDQTNKWVEKNVISVLSGAWTLANQPIGGFTTTATGSWNVGATWNHPGDDVEGSGYPGPSDDAIISGNFIVTLNTASQSVRSLDITGSGVLDGTSGLVVGANSLTIGTGGLVLTGGSSALRIASVTVGGGTLTVQGDVTFATATAANAVMDLSVAANSTLNLAGSMVKSSAGTFIPGTSSTVNFNSSSITQTVNVTNFTYANLKLSNTNSGGVTLGAAITQSNITGNITVAAGIFHNGSYAIDGNGTATFQLDAGVTFDLTGISSFPTNFGTYTLNNTSTVAYSGSAQTVDAARTYGNLTLSGNGIKTISSALTVNNTFTYSSSAQSTLPSTNPSLTTSKFVMNTGTLVDNGGTIVVTGTGEVVWTQSGTFTSTGTIRFTGTAPQISTTNSRLGTIVIAITAGNTATAVANLLATNFDLASGTFDPGVYGHDITSNFTLSAGTTLLVRGGSFVTNYHQNPTGVDPSATIEYNNSTADQTISSAFSYGTLRLVGGRPLSYVKNAGGSLTIGNLIINSDAIFNASSYSHSISGNWTNNGVFTPNTSTIIFNGTSAQTIGGSSSTSFNGITISNPAGVYGISSLSFSTTMVLSAGSTFSPAATDVISGTGTITGSGAIKVTRTGVDALTNQYTLSVNLSGLTVMYESNSSQEVSARSYNNLTIAGTGVRSLASGTTSIAGNLNISAGTLDLGSKTATGGGSGTLTVADGASLRIGGTNSIPSGYSTHSIGANSTIEYYGTNQTISALGIGENYGNLLISTAGAKTLGGTIAVAGNLTISAGTLDLSSFTAAHTGAGVNTLEVANGATLKIGGTNSIPAGYSTHLIGTSSTIEYNGTNQIVGTLNSTQNYGNLLISTTGTKTLGGVIGVASDLTVSAGTLDLSSYTADRTSAGGTLTVSNGATLKIGGTTTTLPINYSTHFLGATSTIEYNGTTQTIGVLGIGENYGNLLISTAGAKTLGGTIGIAGDLTVSAGTLDLSTYTANRTSAGGTLTVSNGATLKIGGTTTLPTNYSTHSLGASSTIEYNGTTQTIGVLGVGENYGNLLISTAGAKTLGGTINVAGDLTISAGILDLSTYTAAHTGVGTNTLTVADGTTLKIGGTNSIPSGYATHVIGASSTIEYNGTNQIVGVLNSSQNYGNLLISTTGTKTLGGNIGIVSDLIISAGVLDLGTSTANGAGSGNLNVGIGATLMLGGSTGGVGSSNFPSGFASNTLSGTVEFNGDDIHPQTIPVFTYTNMTISNLGLKSLAASVTVNGNIKINTNAPFTVSNTGTLIFTGDLDNSGIFVNDGAINP